MKKYLLFLLFALSNSFFAQKIQYKLQKSEVFRDDFKNTNIVLSEINEKKELLLVRSYNGSTMFSQGQGYYIEKYNSKFQLKKAFDFEMKHPNYQKYNLMIGIFTIENNIHFVEVCYDLNEKSFICFDNILSEDFKITNKELFRLPKDNIEQIGTLNLQSKYYERVKGIWANNNSGIIKSENEFVNLNIFKSIFFSNNNIFNYKKALDIENKGIGSDIVLYLNETKTAFAIAIDGRSDETDGLKLYLFDNKLEKKIDVIYENNMKEKKCFFQNILVSNDGNSIYLIAKGYTTNSMKKEEGGKYFYDISRITNENQESQRIEVNEHYIGSLRTYFHDNELISIGFYSNKDENTYEGICFLKIDANTLNLKSSKYNPFTSQFLNDKYGSEKYNALKTITFKKVFFNSNNEIIINAEEEYVSESYNNYGFISASKSAPTKTTSYSFDDIILAKLNSEGDLLWARNINKKQSTAQEDNGFLSYTSILNNDKNYFFINSKEQVKKLKNDRIEFRQIRKNKSNLNIIQVDTNGDFEYEEILDDEENAVPFMVSKGVTIDNAVYFLGRRGSDKQLLKVTL